MFFWCHINRTIGMAETASREVFEGTTLLEGRINHYWDIIYERVIEA